MKLEFPVLSRTEADKKVSATKILLLEKQDHLTTVRWHISVNVFFKINRK